MKPKNLETLSTTSLLREVSSRLRTNDNPLACDEAKELARRVLVETNELPTIYSASDVARYMAPRIGHLQHEEMYILALDGRNHIRAAVKVAQGGAHGCSVKTADVLRAALISGASAFILCHNHPSGDATPSPEDVAMTRAVAAASDVIGCPLVDHVVVAGISGAKFVSIADLGLIR